IAKAIGRRIRPAGNIRQTPTTSQIQSTNESYHRAPRFKADNKNDDGEGKKSGVKNGKKSIRSRVTIFLPWIFLP
ncbi:MAG TPA: hypothetical protein VGH74_05305, partial [Planctomycetaceae bacterium]